MRLRRTPPRHGASALEHDDRLLEGNARAGLEERIAAAGPQAFEVDRDHARVVVFTEIVDVLMHRDVGLIAETDEARESEIMLARLVPKRDRDIAALRYQRDVSARQRRDLGQVQPDVQIE